LRPDTVRTPYKPGACDIETAVRQSLIDPCRQIVAERAGVGRPLDVVHEELQHREE
jgi:hypothetical protein